MPAHRRERRRCLVLCRVELVPRKYHQLAQRARAGECLLPFGVLRHSGRGEARVHAHHRVDARAAQQRHQCADAVLGDKLLLDGRETAARDEGAARGDLHVGPRMAEQQDQLPRRALLQQHIVVEQARCRPLKLARRNHLAVGVGEVLEVSQALQPVGRLGFDGGGRRRLHWYCTMQALPSAFRGAPLLEGGIQRTISGPVGTHSSQRDTGYPLRVNTISNHGN